MWYFPLLMLLGGLVTVIWDGWLSQKLGTVKTKLKRRIRNPEGMTEEMGVTESMRLEERVEGQDGI